MIPKECKRLAEVDFPIATVSKHAAREKSIRHGHPSTLHLWWARRPLAACRAMLLALLLPDPCDEHCPDEFKTAARRLLPQVQGIPGPEDRDLRQALLKFIGDFANWDLSSHPGYLEVARGLVRAAHGEEPPLVVDPFAGGGSIPLEALRLGCDAFASDLNPVACLILKVMLEDIPRRGPELAQELRSVGAQIKEAAEKELAGFYPPDADGARPIAYLWARTVRCEAPNCGAEIPLVRSFWLCKKAHRKRALRYKVTRPVSGPPELAFEVFEPHSEREVPPGTVSRANATCPCCRTVLPAERVRAQLVEQRGGADAIFDEDGRRIGGARLLAVVTLCGGKSGRHYRLPTDLDYVAVQKAQQSLDSLVSLAGPSRVPDEPTPAGGGSGAGRAFSVRKYGMVAFGDLFTARQKLALLAFISQTGRIANPEERNLIAIAVNRMADGNAALSNWLASREEVKHVFGRQALPMVWDFAEVNPFSDATRSWEGAIDLISKVVKFIKSSTFAHGTVEIADACQSPLPDGAASVWITDPPYYDAVPYADLSDFFFVWLKRTLPDNSLLRDPFDQGNPVTPKKQEAVQDEVKLVDGQPKDRAFFEEKMAGAFREGRRVLQEGGAGCVVFAHKTTEGWEALLSGLTRVGWVITGSWPIATEMGSRLRAQDSAALATSVHLICRPRDKNAGIGDWATVLRELPRRVGEWMQRLQAEGVRGADLVFACIGPALEVFSRYERVEKADGTVVELREFLEKVWETVGRLALEQVLGTGGGRMGKTAAGTLEEDARLTALFLWTMQSSNGSNGNGKKGEFVDDEDEEVADEDDEAPRRRKAGGYTLIFDVVRRFAQPLGIHLPDWEGRIIETDKGVVRLLPVRERAGQLRGRDSAGAWSSRLDHRSREDGQLTLFSEEKAVGGRVSGTAFDAPGGRAQDRLTSEEEHRTHRHMTTLDRVHLAMLLQAGGQAHALRELIEAEQDRGPDFLRLANALSALYPRASEEKRLLDAMLLAVRR
ncbi:MAG: DUF1156 domain-containing protein [Bacillota bacterium]|nr:DUF1156 domain-containing protein [Bacillota bacterium]